MKLRSILLTIFTLLTLSCSNDKNSKGEEKKLPISIQFKNESRTILIDETFDIFQDLELTNVEPENIVFYNDNTKVLSFTKGIITGLEKGTSKVIARAKNSEVSSTINILVDERKISFKEEEIELTQGESIDLKQLVELVNIKEDELVWTTEDIELASIDKSTITAKKQGVTHITVSFKNTKNSARIKINIIERKIAFTKESIDLTKGFQIDLAKFIELKNIEHKDIKWEIENPKTVSIDNMKLKGLAPGTTIVSAKYKDTKVLAKLKVAVLDRNIVLTQEDISLSIGDELDLKKIVSVENSDPSQLTWSIENSKLASIKNFTLLGISKGETTITVKLKDTGVSKTIKVTIKEQKLFFTKEKIELIGTDTFDLFSILVHENIAREDIIWKDILPSDGIDITNGIIQSKFSSNHGRDITLNISVKNKPLKAKLSLHIKSRIPTQIEVPTQIVELNLFEPTYIKVTLYPKDADISHTDWGEFDNNIIKRTSYNSTKGFLLEGIALGETTMTISTGDGAVKASFKIRVKGKDEFKFKFNYQDKTIGFTTNSKDNSSRYNNLQYTIYPKEEYANLIWTSNNPNISVDRGDIKYTEGLSTFGTITVTHPKYPLFKETINVKVDRIENILRPTFDYIKIEKKNGEHFGNVKVYFYNNTNSRIYQITDVYFVDNNDNIISEVYAGIGNINPFFSINFPFANVKLKNAYLKYNLYPNNSSDKPIPQKIPLNFKL